MRYLCVRSTSLLIAVALASTATEAQQPRPSGPPPAAAPAEPPPQQAAPPAPYKVMPVTLAKAIAEPSLEAFRKELADIAKKKDRAALAARVVAKGFFWQREDSNVADGKKTGIDNLAAAIGLDAKDGSGWEALGAYVADPTGEQNPEMNGVICTPATPVFNEKDLEQVAETTKTDATEWAYPPAPGLEVHAKPAATAPIVERLGINLLRLYADEKQSEASVDWIRVVTPSGKVGYVLISGIMPLVSDQLCYIKEAGGWRITGYAGGGGGGE
ncbi:MAG TPA: hypothetical protein VK281_10435 [Xanthobacteraceae bacterium]|nr:hypothetical protein [Xanthobacteraceae bacterium]